MTVRSDMLRQNPAYRPRTSHSRAPICAVLVTLIACRAPIPRQPVVAPSPEPIPRATAPTFWRPRRDMLSRAYSVEQEGRVVTTVGSTTVADSVSLRIKATVRRTIAGGAAGLVQSAVVRSADGVLLDPPGLTFPFAFSTEPFPAGTAPVVVARPAVKDPCAVPASTALLPIRDALFGVPDSLYAGRSWSDSAEVTTCRGGVGLRLSIARAFRLRGPAQHEGAVVLVIDRTSRMVLMADAARGTDTTLVNGSGTGTMTFVLDAVTGALLAGDGSNRLELVVRSTTRTQRAVQAATIRIRQLDP